MKNTLFLRHALALFTLLFTAFSYAAPALWQVEKDGKTSYLMGTVHVGTAQMAQLPEKVLNAIKRTDEVVVEVDISELTPIQIQQMALPHMLLPAGKTLQTELKKDTYNALKNYFAERQIDIQLFNQMKPWAVSLTIAAMEYQRAGFNEQFGIDKQVIKFAKEQNIAVSDLETFEGQMAIFDSFSPYSDLMITDTLNQLNEMDAHFKLIVDNWLDGDYVALNEYYQKTFKGSEFGKRTEAALLTNRNNNWMTQLSPRLSQESLFVAVGALHLVGDSGLVKQLKAQGYKVTKL